jgi:hypothetical protein
LCVQPIIIGRQIEPLQNHHRYQNTRHSG